MKEFYLQDTETQYKTIKKFKEKMRDRKIKKYLEVIPRSVLLDVLTEHR